MSIRLVKVKGKTRGGKEDVMYLATTLLDAEQYPSEGIALLDALGFKGTLDVYSSP